MAGRAIGLTVALAGAAVLAVLPPPAPRAAEPVETVLSVATDAPARLVLAYWPERGWIVRQTGQHVELTLPGAQLAIDAPALPAGVAFTSVTVETAEDATYLRIGLGCDCTLAIHGDGSRLAIDAVGAELAAGPIFGADGPAPRLAPAPPHRPGAEAGAAAAAAAGPEGPTDLSETRDRLLGELRRAAETGLVSLRPAPDPTAVSPPALSPAVKARLAQAALPEQPVQAGTEAPGRPAAGPPLEGPPDPRALADPQRRPAAMPETAAAPGPTETAPVCLSNETLRLSDPLPAQDLVREISALRLALIGEFDRPDPAAVSDLARLYIAHRMGTEARGLLDEMGDGLPDRAVLAALASLTEDQPLPPGNILAAEGCTGLHALWQAFDAALAGRNAEALKFEAAATGALEQAARGIRGPFAARIGLAGAALDDRGVVRRLLAMARRAVPAEDAPGRELVQLLEAEDDRLFGDPAGRLATLEKLRRGRSAASETALLALADHAAELPPTLSEAAAESLEGMRLDLGALALSARGTARGEAAFLAEVRLTARTHGRDTAFELLQHGHRDGSLSGPAYRAEIAAMADFPTQAGDAELALVYEADPGAYAASLGDLGFRRALARSYAELGAPGLAESVLRGGDLEDPALPAAIARAYLGAGEPGRASELAALLPEGPERAGILGAAALAAGDPAAALPALVAAEAPAAQRAATAWSLQDWEASLEALGEAGPQSQTGGEAPRAERVRHAARLAYAAMQLGHAEVPSEARALLAEDAEILAGLEAMFVRLAPEPATPDPAEMPGFLSRLTEETRMLEALLDDG